MGQRVSQKSKDGFAKKLKAWRRREKLSQSESAESIAVPIHTLQNWEIARTQPSSLTENLLLAHIAPNKRKRL
jgi:DNA-binding transcriptional regulator YiaG